MSLPAASGADGGKRPTDLVVDLARGHGGIAQVPWVAVRGVQAAAGGNAVGWVIHAAKPTGVVIHATAAQLDRSKITERPF